MDEKEGHKNQTDGLEISDAAFRSGLVREIQGNKLNIEKEAKKLASPLENKKTTAPVTVEKIAKRISNLVQKGAQLSQAVAKVKKEIKNNQTIGY